MERLDVDQRGVRDRGARLDLREGRFGKGILDRLEQPRLAHVVASSDRVLRGTDYTSLRAAMAAAAGAAIELLAPSVADFTDERVSLDKNEALVIVDAEDRVLGYEPGIPDAPGWKLAVSRQTRDGTPVIVYKAAGPATLILMK
jgi:hypothetical protein